MKTKLIRNRRVRYGGVTVLLTLLVLTVVILANAVFGSLAGRYGWYGKMTAEGNYDVTDACYSLLDGVLTGDGIPDIRLIFCDTEENLEADTTELYLLRTAQALAGRYEKVSLEFHDIWVNPSSVKSYAEKLNTTLQSTNLIVAAGEEYFRIYSLQDFFVFAEGDSTQLWAYDGEKKLAAGLLRAANEGKCATVCVPSNHGEAFFDYELMYLLDDAGYQFNTSVDLSKEEIPADCTLVLLYNPSTDLYSATSGGKSETEKLEEFLAVDGHVLLIFLGNQTPRLNTLESFLGEWGVQTLYRTDDKGKSYRYMVKNDQQSLTSDGYTIYGVRAQSALAEEMLDGLNRKVIFKNATALTHATDYLSDGNGGYAKNNRTMSVLYESGSGAASYANGTYCGNDTVALMTLTEQNNGGTGSSSVAVVASAEYAAEGQLQSAVFGNADVLYRIAARGGSEHVPEGITIKPFSSTDISIITTAQMLRWTIVLSVVPTLIVAATGVVILVRRRRA